MHPQQINFLLRPWKSSDENTLAEYANNFEIAKNLKDIFPHPYSVKDARKFIKMTQEHHPVRIFCIEAEGKAIGAIGLHPQQDIMCKNIELGYWLAQPYWGKGIITSAIRQITEYAFLQFDITRIYARPFGSNTASQKALEKAGFVLEARMKDVFYKNGKYEDELIYALRRVNH